MILLFTLFPFLWIVSSSLKPVEDIFAETPKWIPTPITFEHYLWAFDPGKGGLGVFLKNSFLIAGIASLLVTILGALGGYALGRFQFPGKNILSVFILLLQMVQGPLVVVFWYRFSWQLGILDTYWAVILAYLAINLPFGTWLAAGFLSQLPKDLEDAALIDGANHWKIFWRIIMPIAIPGIIAVALYAFVQAWNDYIFALILTQTKNSKTIQIALFDLLSFFAQSNWGGLMAGSVVASLPPVLLFIYLQKYLVSGLTLGSVKE